MPQLRFWVGVTGETSPSATSLRIMTPEFGATSPSSIFWFHGLASPKMFQLAPGRLSMLNTSSSAFVRSQTAAMEAPVSADSNSPARTDIESVRTLAAPCGRPGGWTRARIGSQQTPDQGRSNGSRTLSFSPHPPTESRASVKSRVAGRPAFA